MPIMPNVELNHSMLSIDQTLDFSILTLSNLCTVFILQNQTERKKLFQHVQI